MISNSFKIGVLLKPYLLVAILVLITSCGGGGSSQSADSGEGGISGTGVSVGRISGFSSVILNGSKLDITNQTEIFVDEQPSTESELKVGYVIRVDADFDENTALRIDYVETVRGPLTAVPAFNPDTFAGSFNLLGQSVLTNSATILDGLTDISALSIGSVLDVSGVRDSSGAIIARYINLKTPPVSDYRVLGTISSLSSNTFQIGALTVDFSAADVSELGSGGVENGRQVRVKAAVSGFNSTTTTLTADKITPSTLAIEIMSGDSVELEGVITDFQSISDFEVNGIAVDATNASIENGSAASLQLDVLVEVEGEINSSNTLIAEEVKIIPLGEIRIESMVEAIDTTSRSITILGNEFFLLANTQLEDESPAEIPDFSLEDLSIGDWVEIKAYQKNDELFLTRLERDEPETEVEFQAPVDENGVDLVNKSLSILGITLSTDINTEYEDPDDDSILESEFFIMVQEGDLVKAKWENFTNTSIPVKELSLEED